VLQRYFKIFITIILHHPTLNSRQVYEQLPSYLKDGSIGVTLTYSSKDVVDVIKYGVSKGTALETYCNSIGIRSENVVAFGDMINDIEMLRYAGNSFAVDNAPDEVKKSAKFVTLSNDLDGVAVALEKLFVNVA
jgi:hydroxymethylpyrimidine pyrophosphatase-like HAD family hydrolase